MRRQRRELAVAAAMVILGIGVERAHAQDGEFIGEWLWEVTTDDGDALVEPGETAAVTLSVDLDPSVGEAGQTPGLVISAFGGAKFDVLGGSNADKGQILGWEYPTEELLYGAGDQATTDGTNVFGVTVAQGLGDAPEDTSDPLEVFTFLWTTGDFSGYSVEYMTVTDSTFFFAWEGEFIGQTEFGDAVELVPLEAQVSFDVVPAPGTWIAGVGLSSLLLRRRRCAPGVVVAFGISSGMCAAQQQNPGGQVRIVEESPLLVLFDGLNLADSGIDSQPPDPVIAASESHLVIMVNRTIATYARSELPNESPAPIECVSFTDLFGASSFDPRIVYDHNSGRFVASAQGQQAGSDAALHLAWSQDGDLDDQDLAS